jgi:hypothetical protein
MVSFVEPLERLERAAVVLMVGAWHRLFLLLPTAYWLLPI